VFNGKVLSVFQYIMLLQKKIQLVNIHGDMKLNLRRLNKKNEFSV